MKIKKIIKYTIIGLVSFILIAALGIVVWSKTGTYPAGTTALAALESTDKVTITQDKWIVF